MDSARQAKIDAFDPNGVGLKNGHFIGLPFTEEEAQLIYLGIPWDVTVSYREGTSGGPGNILEASAQLDLIDPDVPQAWHIGHYFRPSPDAWLTINNALRQKSRRYIDFLENGGDVADDHGMARVLEEINAACAEQVERVANATADAACDQARASPQPPGMGVRAAAPIWPRASAKRLPPVAVVRV